MKTYKVVEKVMVEDELVDCSTIKSGIKSLKRAIQIAEDESDNHYRFLSCRQDGLDEYHYWHVIDTETDEIVYRI